MIYSYKDALKLYKNRNGIKFALEKKKIYRVVRGIYSSEKVANPLIIFTKKYSNSIITMDSAFYYYDLTDFIPTKVYLATSTKARKIVNDKIVQIRHEQKLINVGKTEIIIDNNSVPIYDKERLLIELMRKKNKIPFDYYKEIIENYRKISDELDMHKIEEYLKYFKNEDNIFESMMREVF